jgi:hypothetical protein
MLAQLVPESCEFTWSLSAGRGAIAKGMRVLSDYSYADA